jgi:hypothetical protein
MYVAEPLIDPSRWRKVRAIVVNSHCAAENLAPQSRDWKFSTGEGRGEATGEVEV